MSAQKLMKLEFQAEFPYEEESEHPGLGRSRHVGYVVKGTPFRVLLKVVSKSKVSLSNAHVQLQLLAEETYAPVEIGDRPIKWMCTTSGSVICCETRLMVLSTQISKSCVLIKATVSMEGQKPLEVMSCPIKVVSKPEQIRRKRKEANQEPDLDGWKKRARSEDVLVGLRTIEGKLSAVLNDMRHQQALANSSAAEDTLFSEDEACEDAASWTTEEGYGMDHTSYGEPSSFVSCDDTTVDLSDETTCTLAEFEPAAKRPCLVTAFENLLHSYASLCDQQALTPTSTTHPQIQRIQGLFSVLGLPQSLQLDEYH